MDKYINQEQPLTTVEDFKTRYTSAKAEVTARSMGTAGIVSLINSMKNGKRITFSKKFMFEMNSPDNLQLSLSDREIAVGEDLSDEGNTYQLKSVGAKGVIYSTGLVQEITEHFGLDFSDKVSMTFYEATYVEINGEKAAIITIL